MLLSNLIQRYKNRLQIYNEYEYITFHRIILNFEIRSQKTNLETLSTTDVHVFGKPSVIIGWDTNQTACLDPYSTQTTNPTNLDSKLKRNQLLKILTEIYSQFLQFASLSEIRGNSSDLFKHNFLGV